MSGYFTKNADRIYDGDHVSNVELANGQFVVLNGSGKVILNTASENDVFEVAAKEYLWGQPALRLNVLKDVPGVFMVENEFIEDNPMTFNTGDYKRKAGVQTKMKGLRAGDQILVSVSSVVYAAATVFGKLALENDTVGANT